jgi:hypothetical protein
MLPCVFWLNPSLKKYRNMATHIFIYIPEFFKGHTHTLHLSICHACALCSFHHTRVMYTRRLWSYTAFSTRVSRDVIIHPNKPMRVDSHIQDHVVHTWFVDLFYECIRVIAPDAFGTFVFLNVFVNTHTFPMFYYVGAVTSSSSSSSSIL